MMLIDNSMQSILQRDPAAWEVLRRRFLGLDVAASAVGGVQETGGEGDEGLGEGTGEQIP